VVKFNKDAGTELNRMHLKPEESLLEEQMLQEEVNEFKDALMKSDRVEIADALADIIYVAMGTMAKLGMDYEKIMNEVCLSNESKYTDGVLVKNEVGKIQKGADFKSPDLRFVSEVSDVTSQDAFKTVLGSSTSPAPRMTTTYALKNEQ
jgi:phosphoribosyl-ATP pyrophosphohydrolase